MHKPMQRWAASKKLQDLKVYFEILNSRNVKEKYKNSYELLQFISTV